MKRISCLIMVLLVAITAEAQYKAVLVMLCGEKNRTQYFLQRGEPGKASEVRDEAKKVAQVTIDDFTDHFSACPVYYFIDSNLTLLTEGKLDGIILDNKLKPLATSPVKLADSNYLIVYYGQPTALIDEPDKGSDADGKHDNRYYPGDGLVVLGPTFKKDPTKRLFIYRTKFLWLGAKKYSYTSKKFGMEYLPYAKYLHEKL